MNDSTQKHTPSELYREYQNSRDNIPSSVYNELLSKAEQAQHDDNIHRILQLAKVSGTKAEALKQAPEQKPSFADQVKNLFGLAPQKAWGTAFASIALAVIILPIAMNSSPQFPQVSHLEECAQCASYIRDASVTTRSALPGLSKRNPQSVIAAKLGRISASLKISAQLEEDAILNNSKTEIRRLVSAAADTRLSKIPLSETITSEELIAAIQISVSEASQEKAFTAAQAIQIANVTARYALNEGDTEQVGATLDEVIDAFSKVNELSLLQQSILKELQALKTRPIVDDKNALTNAIELYNRAMKSLGA